jgi:GntR family transcriptional repressor for pyruvate dehydrogenase complex
MMNETGLFTTIDTKQRLVDRVAEQITERILDKRLEPGMRLPPEIKLAESLGVSRTVLREAIQILTARGMVETRHGVGTVVRGRGEDVFAQQLNRLLRTKGLSLDHLHQVRRMLEVEIAGIAAQVASPDEVAHLEALVNCLETVSGDPIAYAEADGEFHNALARMAHNPLLSMMLDSVGDILRQVRLTVSRYPELLLMAVPDHRRILERVQAHDAPGARQIMIEHLEHARHIQQALEETDPTAVPPGNPAIRS